MILNRFSGARARVEAGIGTGTGRFRRGSTELAR
jgi:hypothetical protein